MADVTYTKATDNAMKVTVQTSNEQVIHRDALEKHIAGNEKILAAQKAQLAEMDKLGITKTETI